MSAAQQLKDAAARIEELEAALAIAKTSNGNGAGLSVHRTPKQIMVRGFGKRGFGGYPNQWNRTLSDLFGDDWQDMVKNAGHDEGSFPLLFVDFVAQSLGGKLNDKGHPMGTAIDQKRVRDAEEKAAKYEASKAS